MDPGVGRLRKGETAPALGQTGWGAYGPNACKAGGDNLACLAASCNWWRFELCGLHAGHTHLVTLMTWDKVFPISSGNELHGF